MWVVCWGPEPVHPASGKREPPQPCGWKPLRRAAREAQLRPQVSSQAKSQGSLRQMGHSSTAKDPTGQHSLQGSWHQVYTTGQRRTGHTGQGALHRGEVPLTLPRPTSRGGSKVGRWGLRPCPQPGSLGGQSTLRAGGSSHLQDSRRRRCIKNQPPGGSRDPASLGGRWGAGQAVHQGAPIMGMEGPGGISGQSPWPPLQHVHPPCSPQGTSRVGPGEGQVPGSDLGPREKDKCSGAQGRGRRAGSP